MKEDKLSPYWTEEKIEARLDSLDFELKSKLGIIKTYTKLSDFFSLIFLGIFILHIVGVFLDWWEISFAVLLLAVMYFVFFIMFISNIIAIEMSTQETRIDIFTALQDINRELKRNDDVSESKDKNRQKDLK